MPQKPRRQLTDQEIKLLEKYCALRLPMSVICNLLEMGETPILDQVKKRDEVRRAFYGGRAKATTEVHRTLFEMATKDKNFQALKFWCMTREEGFKLKSTLELSGPDGKPIESRELTKDELKARVMQLRHQNDLTSDE